MGVSFSNLMSNGASIDSRGLDVSLSTYADSRVYYRAGDKSIQNLEPKFVSISKTNKATVTEALPENNIISGKI